MDRLGKNPKLIQMQILTFVPPLPRYPSVFIDSHFHVVWSPHNFIGAGIPIRCAGIEIMNKFFVNWTLIEEASQALS